MKSQFYEIYSKWKGEIRLFLFLFIVIALLSILGNLDGLEVKSLDFRFRMRQNLPPNKDIVILAISDECLAQTGRWPWPRHYHGKAIEMLAQAGARAVVFDLIFQDASESDPREDKSLIDACASFGNVILPIHLVPVKIINPETLELFNDIEIFKPFAALASAARNLGFINVDYQNLNADGIIRRVPLTLRAKDKIFPAFALAVAKTVTADNSELITENPLMLNNSRIPVNYLICDDKNSSSEFISVKPSFLVNYQGEATSGAFGIVYYSDFLNGMLSTEIFRNKIVLIGPTATGLGDVKLTPFGEMPGVMIHANILQNLLSGIFLHLPGHFVGLLVLFATGLLALLTLFYFSTFTGILVIGGLIGAYNVSVIIMFLKFQYVFEMVAPTMFSVLLFTSGRFYQMFNSLKQAYEAIKEQNIALECSNTKLDLQVKDLSVLNEVSKRFSSRLSMDLLSIEVMKTFKDLWTADACLLLIAETDEYPPKVLGALEIDDDEAKALLYEPDAARYIKQLYIERKIISTPDGQWFSCYMPLMLGDRFWGAMALKEQNPKPEVFIQREKYCQTLLGIAATALENARLYNLATVDNLTRLFVRQYFQIQLEQEFKRASRYGHDVSLLMTDIDHFKKFNDTYGHQQGDIVLREVADKVKKSLREIDIPSRYGGEEFSLILPETDIEGALTVAERIRKNVETHYVTRFSGGDPLRVTISLGVSSFRKHSPASTEEMIKFADEGLYKAKSSGRNKVEMIC
ncbi:MAG: CHASE2 domain-containing protein [Candidatus Riflebacteria bacterium]|nr:CHASE2 domain-containing protein [Candidatus Riflebacteria bacterium]